MKIVNYFTYKFFIFLCNFNFFYAKDLFKCSTDDPVQVARKLQFKTAENIRMITRIFFLFKYNYSCY